MYARAGVPYYLRVELRGDPPRPTIALDELVDGRYPLVVAAPSGTLFTMQRPFELELDPAVLIE